MECRTLSSRITSIEGSSKVMPSGGSLMRYGSNGLVTLGHTPSENTQTKSLNKDGFKGSTLLHSYTAFIGYQYTNAHDIPIPCHSSSCFLAFRGEVLVGAVCARPLFPPTASLQPSSSSLTGLYLRHRQTYINTK